jgi:hypothetical protein
MSVKDLISEIKRNGLLASMPKLEELYRLSIESEEKIAALEARCAALAAENAGMKAAIPQQRNVEFDNENLDDVSLAEDFGFNDAIGQMRVAVSETPATEAFLAEVRAQGVEMFAASLKVVGGHEHPYSAVANEFAAQLRKGVRS